MSEHSLLAALVLTYAVGLLLVVILARLRVPAGFIGGASSEVVRRVGLAGMRSRFILRKVPGGHLFPFEHPRAAATLLARLLDELETSPRAS